MLSNFLKHKNVNIHPPQVAQLGEHRPIHQKVMGLISDRGAYLGCGFNPQSGNVQKATHLSLSQ